MRFKGSIVTLKASVNASGDSIRRVTLEVFEEKPGEFAALDLLLKRTLSIELKPEREDPFE